VGGRRRRFIADAAARGQIAEAATSRGIRGTGTVDVCHPRIVRDPSRPERSTRCLCIRQAAYSFAEASRRYSAGQLRFAARAAPRTEIIRVREGQPIRRCRSIRGPIPLAMGTPTGPLLAIAGRESQLMTVRSRGCAWRSSMERAVRPTSVG
jgi:hypothetical protein